MTSKTTNSASSNSKCPIVWAAEFFFEKNGFSVWNLPSEKTSNHPRIGWFEEKLGVVEDECLVSNMAIVISSYEFSHPTFGLGKETQLL